MDYLITIKPVSDGYQHSGNYIKSSGTGAPNIDGPKHCVIRSAQTTALRLICNQLAGLSSENGESIGTYDSGTVTALDGLFP